jgi:hypothetical protein
MKRTRTNKLLTFYTKVNKFATNKSKCKIYVAKCQSKFNWQFILLVCSEEENKLIYFILEKKKNVFLFRIRANTFRAVNC